jgi:hypothetical protein
MNKKNGCKGSRDKIVTYLEKELKCYENIEVLAKQQRVAIQSGDSKKLGLLITEKENYIKEIAQLMHANVKCIEELSIDAQEFLSDNTIKKLLKRKRTLLIALLYYDRDGINVLTSSIDDMKKRTGFLGKRRKILNTLKFQQIDTPRYLDILQ